MRILFSEEGEGVGGSVISLFYLVRGLSARGVDPVVTFPAEHGWSARFRSLGIEVHDIGRMPSPAAASATATQSSSPPRQPPEFTRWPAYHTLSFYRNHLQGHEAAVSHWQRRLEELRPEAVYGNNSLPLNFALAVAADRLGLPVFAHLRGFQPLRWPHRAFRTRLRGGIAISDVIRRHYLAAGFPPDRIHRVYNGLDPVEYPFQEPRTAVPPTAGRVIFVGRLTGWKGAPVLLEAMARLRDRRPELTLLIAGDGPARRQWESDARRLGVLERCRFVGFVADVPALLHEADLLVHVSTEPEPFGRVLIEGMASGTPVVASRLGAAPEIMEDGVSGALVPAGDPGALAERIDALLGAAGKRTEMARVARRRVEERFVVETMVAGVERVLKEGMTTNPGHRP